MAIMRNVLLMWTTTCTLLVQTGEVSSFVHHQSHTIQPQTRKTRHEALSRRNLDAVNDRHAVVTTNSSPTRVTADRRTILDQIVQSSLMVGSALAVTPFESRAMSPKEAATAYDSYASTYNDLDGGSAASMFGIDEARGQLLGQARGDVLELGVGTGLNLDSYKPQQISSLTLVDISDGMLQEAKTRLKSLDMLQGVPVKFIKADATSQLVDMFGQRSFDTVVDTFSFCVFGNDGAKKCLDEVRQVVKLQDAGGECGWFQLACMSCLRVCLSMVSGACVFVYWTPVKIGNYGDLILVLTVTTRVSSSLLAPFPPGRVLLLENSRSSNPLLGIYQDATADAAASMGGKGCVYNQDVERIIRGSGMVVLKQQDYAAGLFRSFVCAAPQ